MIDYIIGYMISYRIGYVKSKVKVTKSAFNVFYLRGFMEQL